MQYTQYIIPMHPVVVYIRNAAQGFLDRLALLHVLVEPKKDNWEMTLAEYTSISYDNQESNISGCVASLDYAVYSSVVLNFLCRRTLHFMLS